MEKPKFSLAILAILLLSPNSAGEVQITANGESNILFVDSGQKITFNVTGIENSTSVLWDFGRNISGPDTRYSNLSEVEHTAHASGRYNVTLTANYENEDSIVKEIILIVSFEETFEEKIVHSEALFISIAATEIIMSLGLGYWTSLIRREKVYLWRLLIAIIEINSTETKSDNEGRSSDDSVKVSSASLSPPELLLSWPTLTVGP